MTRPLGRPPALSADACLAALLLAVDPAGLGGAWVTAPAGPERDAWLDFLKERLPEGAPWRRMPSGIADDRLLGGLDLTATLSAGRPVVQRGLLADCDGGALIVPMAERMDLGTAAKLCAVLDAGAVAMERDGLAERHPTRFATVLLDERIEDEAPPPEGLRDRLAFALTLGTGGEDQSPLFADVGRETVLAARARLEDVADDDAMLEAICGAAFAFGVASARAAILALRAARAAAALDGRRTLGEDDAALAVRLVIAPRATRLPMPEEDDAQDEPSPDEAPPDEPPPDQSAEEAPEKDKDKPLDPEALQDLIVASAQAAMPANLLAKLADGVAAKAAAKAGGRAGALRTGHGRGRPVGVRRGQPKPGQRLHVLETLRAAAPWQAVRRRTRGAEAARRLEIRRDDFRIVKVKEHAETVTVFVVDASGSAALARLAEAKGAVELLLADCYIRRDSVAMISFSGRAVDIALPPTRSLVRAKRRLTGLPGGGGTPLADAIDAAGALADAIRRKGQTPVLVFLTDGKANIGRGGVQGRAQAGADALTAAKLLAARGVSTLLVDIAPRPQPAAKDLAAALSARYLPLPHAEAGRLSDAVKGAA